MKKSSQDRFYMSRASAATPGPGNYTLNDDIGSGSGKYILSTVRNALGPKFGAKLEDNTLKSKTFIPGPGTYDQASDFGKLEMFDLKSRGKKKLKKRNERVKGRNTGDL